MSYRLSERPCLKKKDEELQRETHNVDFDHHMNMHTNTNKCAHMCAPTDIKKKNLGMRQIVSKEGTTDNRAQGGREVSSRYDFQNYFSYFF